MITSNDISVVIPTYQRADLVVKAVASVRAQTAPVAQVIVVVDGEDDATIASLKAIDDPRLKIVLPSGHVGNAAARNAGLAAATGGWIALLDDDDLWLPNKLAVQLKAAHTALENGITHPIVSCRIIARSENAEFTWPRLMPRSDQPISEYLFCRRNPGTGDGIVQTSTILAPKALFDAVQFDPQCKRFVDIDWLLRAVRHPSTKLVFPSEPEPLSVWSMEDRPRISNRGDWREDVAWIDERRALVTPRAAAAFLLTLPSLRAARNGDFTALPALLGHALRSGRPGLAELIFHLGNFALPENLKQRLTRRNTK